MYPEDEQAQKDLEKQCREEVLSDPDRGTWLREIINDLNISDITWRELFDHFYDWNVVEVGEWFHMFCYDDLKKLIQEETELRIARTEEEFKARIK